MLQISHLLWSRLYATAPWALRHLIISLSLGVASASFVFGLWFPAPFRELSGGLALFFLMLGVDVVCGPLLSLLLLHPSKTRRALVIDIGLIACIQLSALVYGLHALSYARPVAVVHEVDRFRVVSYADIEGVDQANMPEWVRPWGWGAPRVLSIRSARSSEERLSSLGASLQGVEPGQRPDWWQDYAMGIDRVRERALPLDVLQSMNPEKIHLIQTAAAEAAQEPKNSETSSPNALLWLPLVSRQAMDWVVLLDPTTLRIRGYAHVDGFAK